MKQYDALYIFTGVSRDEVLQANLDKALAEVTRLGGELVGQNTLGKRAFARPMKKRDSGVYVKVRFSIDPAALKELVDRYRLVEEVFRVQILAVDDRREAKIASERQARAERQAKREASKEAQAVEA